MKLETHNQSHHFEKSAVGISSNSETHDQPRHYQVNCLKPVQSRLKRLDEQLTIHRGQANVAAGI